MRNGWDPSGFLDSEYQVVGEVTRGASCAIGNGNERGFIGLELGDDFIKCIKTFLGTRRKELKRE
jgi:hypothetical protein